VEVERLTSATTTPEQIEQAIVRLMNGTPAVGPPVPEHLRAAANDAEGVHEQGSTEDRGRR
jgi:hypothetical protein